MRWDTFTASVTVDVTGSMSQVPLQTLEQFVFPLAQSFTVYSSNVCSLTERRCLLLITSVSYTVSSFQAQPLPYATVNSGPSQAPHVLSLVFSIQPHVFSLLPFTLSCTHNCNSLLQSVSLPCLVSHSLILCCTHIIYCLFISPILLILHSKLLAVMQKSIFFCVFSPTSSKSLATFYFYP